MTRIFSYIFIIAISLGLFFSCEEIISPELDTATPQLVIDASIDWQKGTSGNTQTIRMYTTNAYFARETAPAVSGAIVKIFGQNNTEFVFDEKESGSYTCEDFVPQIGQTYTLDIRHNGNHYTATDLLQAAPKEVLFTQKKEGGLLGNAVELRGHFNGTDDKNNNYHLVKIENKYDKRPSYIDLDGRYYSQGRMFFIYINEDLVPKDTLDFRLYRISGNYSNYIGRLLNNTSSSSGPFSTVPASVRSNIVNQTNPDANPLGAFRVTQYIHEQYIVKEE